MGATGHLWAKSTKQLILGCWPGFCFHMEVRRIRTDCGIGETGFLPPDNGLQLAKYLNLAFTHSHFCFQMAHCVLNIHSFDVRVHTGEAVAIKKKKMNQSSWTPWGQ